MYSLGLVSVYSFSHFYFSLIFIYFESYFLYSMDMHMIDLIHSFFSKMYIVTCIPKKNLLSVLDQFYTWSAVMKEPTFDKAHET